MKFWHLLLLHAPSTIQHSSAFTSICKVSSFIFHADCPAYSASLVPGVTLFFLFQMVALNFECILLMLKDGGSIPRDTLQSQDRINLGDIHFCPCCILSACNTSPSVACAPSSPRVHSHPCNLTCPQTKWDNFHSPGVPGGQQARENYQHFCGTCGLLSRLPSI